MIVRKVLVVYPILYHYRRGVFKSLDEDGRFEVTFASAKGGLDGIAAMEPGELRRYVELTNVSLFGGLWQKRLVSHLLKESYDDIVFLGNAAYLSSWIGAMLGRLRGSRVYFWTIGWHRPENGLKRLVRLVFYRLAHGLLLYGEIARSIGVSAGYPEARMSVIGNSIGSTRRPGEVACLNLPVKRSAEEWVGAVVRLTPAKNLPLLLEAVAILRSQGMPLNILIVGEGPQRGLLSSLAERLNVPLLLPGEAYSAGDLEKFYELIDVTVVPSAVGLTAIQSLSAGVPVISDDSAFDQMPEWEAIRPGRTGEIYVAGDAAALAESIREALRLVRNDGVNLSRRCRDEVAANWSPEVHASRIAEALLGNA